jgi:hypothetical protein
MNSLTNQIEEENSKEKKNNNRNVTKDLLKNKEFNQINTKKNKIHNDDINKSFENQENLVKKDGKIYKDKMLLNTTTNNSRNTLNYNLKTKLNKKDNFFINREPELKNEYYDDLALNEIHNKPNTKTDKFSMISKPILQAITNSWDFTDFKNSEKQINNKINNDSTVNSIKANQSKSDTNESDTSHNNNKSQSNATTENNGKSLNNKSQNKPSVAYDQPLYNTENLRAKGIIATSERANNSHPDLGKESSDEPFFNSEVLRSKGVIATSEDTSPSELLNSRELNKILTNHNNKSNLNKLKPSYNNNNNYKVQNNKKTVSNLNNVQRNNLQSSSNFKNSKDVLQTKLYDLNEQLQARGYEKIENFSVFQLEDELSDANLIAEKFILEYPVLLEAQYKYVDLHSITFEGKRIWFVIVTEEFICDPDNENFFECQIREGNFYVDYNELCIEIDGNISEDDCSNYIIQIQGKYIYFDHKQMMLLDSNSFIEEKECCVSLKAKRVESSRKVEKRRRKVKKLRKRILKK